MIITNGSADVSTYFVLRDSTNHAPKTDVTVTDLDLYYAEQGAVMSAKADASALAAADSAHSDNAAFHVGQGLYRIDWPDAAFDAGVGKKVVLVVVCSGVDTTFLEVELSPGVNVASVGGTAQTAGDLAVLATAIKAKTDYLPDSAPSTNAELVTAIEASSVLAKEATLGTVSTNVSSILADTGTDGVVVAAASKTGYTLSAAGVQAIWDALSSALVTAGSIGKRIVDYLTGDSYARLGAPAGVSHAADVALVKAVADAVRAKTDNLPPAPAAVGSNMGTVTSVTGSVGSVAANGISATSIAANALTSTKFAAGALASGVFGAGAIPAAALAADVGPAIADSVCDELLSGHAVAGSVGAALSSASSAGDPWATILPGSYPAGSAGHLLATQLDATISSRLAGSSYTAPPSAATVATAVLDDLIEGAVTLRAAMRGLNAFCLGVATGGGTATVRFRDLANTKDRIVATVNPTTGDRSDVTLNLS